MVARHVVYLIILTLVKQYSFDCDYCLTTLKLVDWRKHSLYTSLIREIKREIKDREKVGVLV